MPSIRLEKVRDDGVVVYAGRYVSPGECDAETCCAGKHVELFRRFPSCRTPTDRERRMRKSFGEHTHLERHTEYAHQEPLVFFMCFELYHGLTIEDIIDVPKIQGRLLRAIGSGICRLSCKSVIVIFISERCRATCEMPICSTRACHDCAQ
jgi:hypothetical protein